MNCNFEGGFLHCGLIEKRSSLHIPRVEFLSSACTNKLLQKAILLSGNCPKGNRKLQLQYEIRMDVGDEEVRRLFYFRGAVLFGMRLVHHMTSDLSHYISCKLASIQTMFG